MKPRTQLLLDHFKKNPALTTLEIDNMTVEEDFGDLLDDKELQNIEILILKDSFFTNTVKMEKLVSAISQHPKLKKLMIEQCSFDDLKNPLPIISKQLESLSFSNMIHDNVVAAVLKSVTNGTKTLKKLSFSVVTVGKDIISVLDEIISKNETIEIVEINESAIENISSLIKSNTLAKRSINFIIDDSVSEDIKIKLSDNFEP